MRHKFGRLAHGQDSPSFDPNSPAQTALLDFMLLAFAADVALQGYGRAHGLEFQTSTGEDGTIGMTINSTLSEDLEPGEERLCRVDWSVEGQLAETRKFVVERTEICESSDGEHHADTEAQTLSQTELWNDVAGVFRCLLPAACRTKFDNALVTPLKSGGPATDYILH